MPLDTKNPFKLNCFKSIRKSIKQRTDEFSLDNLDKKEPKSIHRQTRFIEKSGKCNVAHGNLNNSASRYFSDIFTTIVDLPWVWSLIIFSVVYVSTWLLFALAWYVISWGHGDLTCVNAWGYYDNCLTCYHEQSHDFQDENSCL